MDPLYKRNMFKPDVHREKPISLQSMPFIGNPYTSFLHSQKTWGVQR